MNEKIKELAQQAGASRIAGVNGLVFRDADLEHFTRLIVKECVSAIPLDMDHTEFLTVMRAVKNTFSELKNERTN